MPRKKKTEELQKWISEYKSFVFEVAYPEYKLKVAILNNDEHDAANRVRELYPGSVSRLLGQTHKTHV